MVTRLIESRIRRSKKSLMLLGARQVGKSTLMRSLGPDVVINLADEALYLGYAKDPERLKRELAALRKTSLVLIDEVQRVPALLNTVQAVLDEGATHRFLLTGSSARKLKRGGANLLPGRIVLEHLDPLTIWELGDAFDLERALCVGMLPGVYLDADEGDAVLETYASVYLREEIQAEAVLRDIGSYARFLDTAAATNGDWVNYAKLASDSEIAKETLRRYYQVLEDTLIAFRLPSFSPAASTRRVTQRERILLFDIGVRNALVGQHRHAPSPTQRGHLFEQWLILQCLAYARALRLPWKLSSYRTDGGAEVDLVIDTGRELIGIECKAGRQVTRSQLSGLRSLAEVAHRPLHKWIAYTGDKEQRFDGDFEAIPYRQLLLERLPELAARTN